MVLLIVLPLPEMHFPLFCIFEICSNVTGFLESSLMSQDKIKFSQLVVDDKHHHNCSSFLYPRPLQCDFSVLSIKRGDLFPTP